jgi:hypothetical protein
MRCCYLWTSRYELKVGDIGRHIWPGCGACSLYVVLGTVIGMAGIVWYSVVQFAHGQYIRGVMEEGK